MKKISLNPEINMTLKEFKDSFKNHFVHIVPKNRDISMKEEYDRIMSDRKNSVKKEFSEKSKKITGKLMENKMDIPVKNK